MANVDLYGADAGRIRDTYRSALRRDASDDEVTGWLSGSYGGGGIDDWLRQISSSHEARQYTPPTPTPTPPIPPGLPPSGLPPGVQTTTAPDLTPQHPSGTPQGWTSADPAFANYLNYEYQHYLGRPATTEEIGNWWNGVYGPHRGWEGFGWMREQIRNSHEARARNNGQAPENRYQDVDWWRTQGVRPEDMFDTTTGQLKPGWVRSGRGYEWRGQGRPGSAPTGGTPNTPTGSAPPPGGYQTWVMGRLGSGPSSPEALGALEAELARYGIRLQKDSNGVIRGRLYLPDGTVVDVVPPGGWGQPWQWIVRGTGGSSGGTNTGAMGPGINLPGNQYSDEYTQLLEELAKSRIAMLQQPWNDPYRAQYMAAMQKRADELASGLEPSYQQLLKRLEQRFNDLQGPGYTGAENEVIRTQSLDPLERDRAAAKKRVIERMAAAGHTMESGVMQMALLEVDKAFDSDRGATQNALAMDDLQRREGRQQRADMISEAMYKIPRDRALERLDLFGALEQIENLMRQEEQFRSREQLSLAGMLADTGPNRLQLAMQAAGMGGNYQPMSSMLMGLAGLNQQASLMNQQNRSGWLRGLGSTLYYLSQAGR